MAAILLLMIAAVVVYIKVQMDVVQKLVLKRQDLAWLIPRKMSFQFDLKK